MKLEAQKRETNGVKAEKLRAEGFMPMVSYGPKSDSQPLQVKVRDFQNVWKEAGETSVVTLKTDDDEIDALIHDIEIHPTTGEPLHADFYVMEKGKPVQVSVPLEFEGEAPAIENLGGVLVKVIHEVDVEALPRELPNEIVVDISSLKELDDHIAVSDLSVANGVTIITPEDETVASVTVQEEEPEEDEQEEVDLSEAVEVEQKGKQEDTEESEEETS